MKFVNRLEGMIEAIGDLERAIETNKSQIKHHEANLTDDNGNPVRYHFDQLEKYESANLILQIALDYVMELDIRRLHKFDEFERAEKEILYEVEE